MYIIRRTHTNTCIGLPRTGTNSFCAALGILLDGPPYHTGRQYGSGVSDESHILTWIDVIKRRPYKTPEEKKAVLVKINRQLDGYVATADPPLSQLVPELIELYPDAKVICSTRDREKWADSMVKIAKLVQPNFINFIFFWIPSMRHMGTLSPLLTDIFVELYGLSVNEKQDALAVYDRHHAWLEEIVPRGKLFYADVKEGWGPLCKALDLPVPEDTPFPNLNDGESIEKAFKDLAKKGLMRWAMFAVVVSVVISAGVWFWRT